jgi:hypothetical protein
MQNNYDPKSHELSQEEERKIFMLFIFTNLPTTETLILGMNITFPPPHYFAISYHQ